MPGLPLPPDLGLFLGNAPDASECLSFISKASTRAASDHFQCRQKRPSSDPISEKIGIVLAESSTTATSSDRRKSSGSKHYDELLGRAYTAKDDRTKTLARF
jgi:hypothetical protein